jgi:hypothetical protein
VRGRCRGRMDRGAQIVWAAGVAASPAAAWLGVAADPAGRVPVEPDLRVPGAWQADARPCAGREAARRLCGQNHPLCSRRPSRAAAIPLPRLRQPCHDRAAGSGRGFRQDPTARRRHGGSGARPTLPFWWACATDHCSRHMVLGLLDLPAQQPPHHRFGTLRSDCCSFMDCARKTSGRGGPHSADSARVSTAAQDEIGQVRQLGAAGCEKVFREKITGTRPTGLKNAERRIKLTLNISDKEGDL